MKKSLFCTLLARVPVVNEKHFGGFCCPIYSTPSGPAESSHWPLTHSETQPTSARLHFVRNSFRLRNSVCVAASLGKVTLTRKTPRHTVPFRGCLEVVGALQLPFKYHHVGDNPYKAYSVQC